jgi:hypothetical protein
MLGSTRDALSRQDVIDIPSEDSKIHTPSNTVVRKLT